MNPFAFLHRFMFRDHCRLPPLTYSIRIRGLAEVMPAIFRRIRITVLPRFILHKKSLLSLGRKLYSQKCDYSLPEVLFYRGSSFYAISAFPSPQASGPR
jgi:hypothetical protein